MQIYLSKKNGSNIYWVTIVTLTQKLGKVQKTEIFFEAVIQFKEILKEKNWFRYELTIKNRRINGSFSQKIANLAHDIASIHNHLDIATNNQYKLAHIFNTKEVQNKWEQLKPKLLKRYHDIFAWLVAYDVQLQDNSIQDFYLNDNFFNFFFPAIFNRVFETDEKITDKKILAKAVEETSIPIFETKSAAQKELFYNDITVSLTAEVDETALQKEKINTFLGDLELEEGSKHELDFDYQGDYIILPHEGIIKKGHLDYIIKIGESFSNQVSYNIELQEYE